MIFAELLLLAIGFAILIKGADWFVDGCSHFASALGVSQIVIGLTIVAMGTSMPEAAVSITAALKDTADIAVGNIVGSNIINILIILGLTSLLIPIRVDDTFRKKDIPFMGAVTILLVVLGMTGEFLQGDTVLYERLFVGVHDVLIRNGWEFLRKASEKDRKFTE